MFLFDVFLRSMIASILREPPFNGNIWKYRELANNLETYDFCNILHLGGYGRLQNTPTGRGNHLPTRMLHFYKFDFIICICVMLMFVSLCVLEPTLVE